MYALASDVKHAVRSLKRSPGFTITSILLISLGAAGSTAMWAITSSVLLRPLPFSESQQLATLSLDDGGPVSGQLFGRVRESVREFTHVVAQGPLAVWNLTNGNTVGHVSGFKVSTEYFATLGVRPLLGREFNGAEERPGGARAIVLSEGVWRRRFTGDKNVIGRSLLLGRERYEIVGVMPATAQTFPAAEVWIPLQVSPTSNARNLRVIGRLRDESTLTHARLELATLKGRLTDVRAAAPEEENVVWTSYLQTLTGNAERPIWMLSAVVFCLLLVSCGNVVGVSLVRMNERRREMSTRMAIGGTMWDLLRCSLVESTIVAGAGGAAGLLFAWLFLQTAIPFIPPELLAGRPVNFDWIVLAWTFSITIGVGLICGVIPAIMVGAKRRGILIAERGTGLSFHRCTAVRRCFVVGELALTVTVLVNAGLLIRTYLNLEQTSLGFEPRDVIVGEMSLDVPTGPEAEKFLQTLESTLTRVGNVPGVESVAIGGGVPIARGINLPLEPPAKGLITTPRPVDWRYVSPKYFDVLEIPLRRGRQFDHFDNGSGRAVAVVNETFALEFFGSLDVVGKHLRLANGMAGDPSREIVGVVGDVKCESGATSLPRLNAVASAPPPMVFVPLVQMPRGLLATFQQFYPATWVFKVHPGNPDLLRRIVTEIKSNDLSAPFIRMVTMNEIVHASIRMERFRMQVVMILAVLVMSLAAIGLYGLIAYSASTRAAEIGLRMALGARPSEIVKAFVADGLRNVAIALGVGTIVAFVTSRVFVSFYWGVSPMDARTYLSVSLLLVSVSLIAVAWPSYRASRMDPVKALRG